MNPSVRRAGPGDAPMLARLRWEFRASYGVPDETEVSFLARCEPWIAERLAPPGGRWSAWIAEAGSAAIGAIWVQWIEKIPNPVVEPEWHAYLTSFYVRASFRGRQVGSALLQAALSESRRREVDSVILWPTPESRSLYARHGFAAAGVMELRDAQ